MPSYTVTYLEEKTLTMWAREGATEKELSASAVDHIALSTYAGQKSKLLSVELTTPEPPK